MCENLLANKQTTYTWRAVHICILLSNLLHSTKIQQYHTCVNHTQLVVFSVSDHVPYPVMTAKHTSCSTYIYIQHTENLLSNVWVCKLTPFIRQWLPVVKIYKVVQIWLGQTVTCLHTNRPGHIWTTLYIAIIIFWVSMDHVPMVAQQVPNNFRILLSLARS